jgi:DnaK suppressor protein
MRRKELLSQLVRTLLRRRAALAQTLARHERMIAVDNRAVGDQADAATDEEQDAVDSQLASVESRELAAIDDALDRIRQKQFGQCEICDKPIPAARLIALPYATRCIGCQRDEEERSGPAPRSRGQTRASDEIAT